MPPRSRRLRQRQQDQEAVAKAPPEAVDEEFVAPEAPLAEADQDWDEGDLADAPVDPDDFHETRMQDLEVDLDEAEADDLPVEELPAAGGRSGRSGRRSRRGASPEDEADDQDSNARSSRRSGRRSSRSGPQSAKGKAVKRSRKSKSPATPEDALRRRALMRKLLFSLLILICLIGGGIAVYAVLHEDPITIEVERNTTTPLIVTGGKRDVARTLLQEAGRHHTQMLGAISSRQPELAAKHQADGQRLLQQDLLGNISESPDPEDPTLASVQQALQAYELFQNFEAGTAKINRVRDDLKAERNQRTLAARLSSIDKEPDLNALQKDIEDFLNNPVEPASGTPLIQGLDRFQAQISTLRGRLDEIGRERTRRLRGVTTDIVTRANNDSDAKIQKGLYSEALGIVDSYIGQYPDASLAPVRSKVINSAKTAWQTAQQAADSNWNLYRAAGTNASDRAKYLDAAIAAMSQVIQTYGDASEVAPYVREAQQRLERYRAAQ